MNTRGCGGVEDFVCLLLASFACGRLMTAGSAAAPLAAGTMMCVQITCPRLGWPACSVMMLYR